MIGYWFEKLADALDAEAKSHEAEARQIASVGTAGTMQSAVTGQSVAVDVTPMLMVAVTLHAIASVLRKVVAP